MILTIYSVYNFMIPKEIKSLQHPIVKHLVLLRNERSYRYEQQSVLIVGKRVIKELRKETTFKTLILEEGYADPSSFNAKEVFFVTKEILKKITGLQNPEGIAAEIQMPVEGSLEGKNHLIVLDGVSDPGNLGTLLRTALALGWDGAYITENSVDPFNDKALRAAKGATFHLPLIQGSWENLHALIEKHGYTVFIADKNGTTLKNTKPQKPLMLVLGNETRGANVKAKKNYTSVSIPMHPSMESLNVASAGAILMYGLI